MHNLQIPKVNKGFVNKKGDYFKDVREVAFNEGELYGNLGKLVAKTEPNDTFMFDSDLGVYIYQSNDNKNIAYRIYKCFADYGFDGFKDDYLIQNLYDRSSNVNNISFPTGVVTLGGRIIGQEIPYFSHHSTLYQYLVNNIDVCPIKFYRLMLESIKEMYESGIIYSDLHAKNFMIDLLNHDNIEVIDFESSHVKFDDMSYNSRINLLNGFKNMIIGLNNLYSIDYEINSCDSFDDMNDELYTLEKVFNKN
jgi:hypothetical protein